MKIKLLLTTLICFNIAATAYADDYAFNGYIEEQPKLRRTILQKINDKLDELEHRYHVKSYAIAIAANVLLLSISMRLQDKLTSASQYDIIYPGSAENKVTFNDVTGLDEAKDQIKDFINFTKDPKKYTDRNAEPPKGLLLVGEPGTGKTMIAKAIGNEAGLPVIFTDGSKFQTKWAGSGPAEVKSIQKEIDKIKGNVIVFIDEADTVLGNQNTLEPYRYETTNALKVWMDGFKKQTDGQRVFFIAATNHGDKIDNAMKRPGRFTTIPVSMPTKNQFTEMLINNFSKLKTTPNIDFNAFTEMIYNLNATDNSGAKAAAISNAANLISIRNGATTITYDHIKEAVIKCNSKFNTQVSTNNNFRIPPMPQQVPAVLS